MINPAHPAISGNSFGAALSIKWSRPLLSIKWSRPLLSIKWSRPLLSIKWSRQLPAGPRVCAAALTT